MAKKKKGAPDRQPAAPQKARVAKSTATRSTANTTETTLVFGKKHYIFMGIGLALILLGFALMTGGGMDDPNVWDEGRIYSFRRITLAPFLILAGIVMNYLALFRD